MQWYACLMDRKNMAVRVYLDAIRDLVLDREDGACLNLDKKQNLKACDLKVINQRRQIF
jgi:hypothetical protein